MPCSFSCWTLAFCSTLAFWMTFAYCLTFACCSILVFCLTWVFCSTWASLCHLFFLSLSPPSLSLFLRVALLPISSSVHHAFLFSCQPVLVPLQSSPHIFLGLLFCGVKNDRSPCMPFHVLNILVFWTGFRRCEQNFSLASFFFKRVGPEKNFKSCRIVISSPNAYFF